MNKSMLMKALMMGLVSGMTGPVTHAGENQKMIPTDREMPTPEKYKNTRKAKSKTKKKRGY